jgi:beta-mannosidase
MSHPKTSVIALLAVVLLALAPAVTAGPAASRVLARGWQFRLLPTDPATARRHAPATHWHAATVPGSVQTDLLAQGLIADPYAGAAEADLQWIGLGDWAYRTTFDVDAATLARRHQTLVFAGLDTFAEVWLNGTRLLDADNMFRTWRVPVDGRLRAHGNVLQVVLRSPIRRLLPEVRALTTPALPGAYPSMFGDEPRDVQTANYVRKAAYQYGWDWGPRYVTLGIWKPVRLESGDALRVADFHIRQDAVGAASAELTAMLDIDSDRAGPIDVALDYAGPDGITRVAARRRVVLKQGAQTIAVPLRIAHPRLWYPAGYGAQDMYVFHARIADADGVQAEATRRTGLRHVELRRDRDRFGRGFAFVVNGIPIFAKGANLIPFDSFPARVTVAQQRRILQSARDAHMNMLRVWGGGYYGSDAFYAMADELGLMIWQDFAFGGAMPPAYDPAFRANVRAEARDQLRRLRDHPSIVLWCGNNEIETSWAHWGNGEAMEKADPAFARRVHAGYVQLFGRDLRDLVAADGNGVPYWSSSPGTDLDGGVNVDDDGDMHAWDVWAGSAPISDYLKVAPRFMSEYGLQSLPSLRTLRTFATADDLRADSAVMRAHQKFDGGNGNLRLLHYIREGYGEPADFASFVYLSQVMQAEGIELEAEHLRAARPRTMGSLYWQLNDVWPGASWSSIDWYGRWKALQFHARRFYAPLLVAPLRRDGTTRVALVSDRIAAVRGTLRTRVLGFDGRVIRDETRAVTLPSLSSTDAAHWTDAALLRGADPRRTFAVFELSVDGRCVSRQFVYFAAARDLILPDPGLRATLRTAGDSHGYTLELHAARLARAVWIDFGDIDVDLSDNALTVLPGETLTLHVASAAPVERLRRQLTLRSLYGATRATLPAYPEPRP